MSPTVQLMIVATVICAAAAYLGRSVWRKVSARSTESGCGTCGQAAAETNVVPLETLSASIDRLQPPRN